jgi:RHS repeat-associated protein
VTGGGGSWGIAWALDAFGNRTSQTPSGSVTSTIGTQTMSGWANNRHSLFGYDAAGDITNDGAHTYSYDAEGRITQVDGGTVQFGYDGDGRRVKKTAGSTTTFYLYGQTGLMSEFMTANTGATQAATTNSLQYRVSDQTGTATAMVSSAGTEYNKVLPYGESLTTSSIDQKFTTYDRESTSNLDYAMARFYANRYGRFMSPDPGHIGGDPANPQSWNAYAYGGNDPINTRDPEGLDYEICDNNGSCIYNYSDEDFWRYFQNASGVFLTGNGLIIQNGQFIGTYRYVGGDWTWQFIREMDRRVDASNEMIAAAAGTSVVVGATGGIAANYLGLTTGSGLTSLGRIGIQLAKPTPGQIAQMERVLAQQGKSGVEKALRTLERRLAEHLEKIRAAKDAGGYTSSMEREVQNFRQLIEAAKKVLGRQ